MSEARVPIVMMIREVATGQVREVATESFQLDGAAYPDEFRWSDGNMACDCNRLLAFARACGVAVPSDARGGLTCGDTAYEVNLRLPDGRVFYREFD